MIIQLKKYRKKHQITQKQLADRLGCSQANIALIESGRQDIGVRKLHGWCQQLGVSLVDIIPDAIPAEYSMWLGVKT
ncbi:helix-turn-helix transcriptional regulator [uncultured Paraglaciecola sp.]|uniref:helix-turn-helix domain-containing protein n=1 Tax=uncultured Paraglaciecola sp. TaxID=1765024 RepID=UPI00262954CD|nr:helix-turn-helix transcriptional regulator [uncultured Paraglaciecola sp.]